MSRCEAATPPLRNNSDWTGCQLRELVRLYRRQACLWNKDDPTYVDCKKRRLAYEAICNEISRDTGIIEVMFKIREIRRIFIEEWKSIVKSQNFEYEPQVYWFKEMNSFLFDYLHIDEIESIELLRKGPSSCSSSYYYEDSTTSSPIYSSKLASRCLSETSSNNNDSKNNTTNNHNSNNNNIDDIKRNNNCSNATEISRKKKPCRCKSMRFSSGVESSQIMTQRRTKSDPIVCDIGTIQSLEREEDERNKVESMSPRRLTVRKSCDSYDLFAKRIACRLKKMTPEDARAAQKQIESLLTQLEYRVDFDVSSSASSGSTFPLARVDPRHENSRTFIILGDSKSQLICGSQAASSLYVEASDVSKLCHKTI